MSHKCNKTPNISHSNNFEQKQYKTFFDFFFIHDIICTIRQIFLKVSDIMILKNDISTIKSELCDRKGQKIMIRGSLGRNKAFEEEAVIMGTYSDIFVVEEQERNTNDY